MAAETIREYLVALGFDVDESSFRKFNSSVLKTTEPVLKLGAAAVAAATAIEVMVERVARQMEDLYYASQRTGAAVASLQAVGFAAKQVGLEAGQGRDLVEGLARAMRMNPGIEGAVQAFGIATRSANGHLRDTVDIVDDVLKRLAAMPRFEALQLAPIFGFDPDTLNQILNNLPQFLKAQDDARRSLKDFGLDQQQVSQDAAEFSRHLNALEQNFGNLVTRVAHDWLPTAERLIDDANTLVVDFGHWNDAMAGTPGKIGSIVIALGGLIGALKIIAGLKRFLGFGGTSAGAAAAEGGGILSFLLKRLGPIGAFLATMSPSSTDEGEDAYMRSRPDLYPDAARPGVPGTPGASSSVPLGIRSNNPGNLMPGGVEARFPTPLAGLSAMAGNLLAFAQRGRDTIEKIVAKWAPAAAGNDVAAYVADLVKRTGFGASQHLDLADPGTLERLMSAMIVHEQGQNPYSHDLIAAAIAGRLGTGANVNLTQKTEINVNGASDPVSTARRVGDEQGRINGDLARNLASVVR